MEFWFEFELDPEPEGSLFDSFLLSLSLSWAKENLQTGHVPFYKFFFKKKRFLFSSFFIFISKKNPERKGNKNKNKPLSAKVQYTLYEKYVDKVIEGHVVQD